MSELRNKFLSLLIDEKGNVALEDRKRKCRWLLDRATCAFRRGRSDGKNYLPGKIECTREAFPEPGIRTTEGKVEVAYSFPDGNVLYLWALASDHVEVRLRCGVEDIEFVALPGMFHPEKGSRKVLLPVAQGVLCKGEGRIWEDSVRAGAYSEWSMCMAAVLGEKGALLVTQETPADWVGTRGEDSSGMFFVFEQWYCPVNKWYERVVRLYPVDCDITAVCRRYRDRVRERGDFVSWEEKIARKPIVKNLFGALMAFIGYNRTGEIDFVKSAQCLKDYGFEKIFYYPVRFCHYTLDFKMGGDEPIWLSEEELREIKKIPGSFISPWGWLYEILDDGSAEVRGMMRHDVRGQPVPNWKIDDLEWYEVCTPYAARAIKKRYEGDMAMMDWIHYDVSASRSCLPCFNTAHALHDRTACGRREGLRHTLDLLGPETNGNRVVSSEGFLDLLTKSYDIGSAKMLPSWGDAPCISVPMTMLVFHDSTIQDWWELFNYNAHRGFMKDKSCRGFGMCGAGRAEKKAAMDALYGLPPNLFPFGRQYGWADLESRKTYSYTVKLDDEEVQRAIKAALPVTRLHSRIGMSDLVSFRFVTEDKAVQETVFSDGTRIAANISDGEKETDEFGRMAANSWKEV